MKRAIAMLLACCVLLGAAVAVFMMFAAWQHNPQGEFHELASDGAELVHWGHWGLLGALWFSAVFVPTSLLGAGVIALAHHFDRRRSVG